MNAAMMGAGLVNERWAEQRVLGRSTNEGLVRNLHHRLTNRVHVNLGLSLKLGPRFRCREQNDVLLRHFSHKHTVFRKSVNQPAFVVVDDRVVARKDRAEPIRIGFERGKFFCRREQVGSVAVNDAEIQIAINPAPILHQSHGALSVKAKLFAVDFLFWSLAGG